MDTNLIINDGRMKSLRRSVSFDRASINAEARTVELSFVSEAPVERYFGMEILECSARACDLTRLNDGAPLLWCHDPEEMIGVIERARIDSDKVGRAVVRFSKSKEGDEYFQDVVDGIIRKVSVGYTINSIELVSEIEGVKSFKATSWTPYEVSLVSIPADNSVGVGRSAEASVGTQAETVNKPEVTVQRNIQMSDTNPAPTLDVKELANLRSQEASRIREINAIGTKFQIDSERTMKAIENGESLDSFRSHVLEKVGAKPVQVSAEIGMSQKERGAFSITKAIREMTDGGKLTGLEKEMSDAATKHYGRSTSGFIIPHDVNVHRNTRALNTGSAVDGGYLVQDQVSTSIIELLRNRSVVSRAGATQLGGLVGNVVIPRITGGATAYWLANGATAPASQQKFGQLGMTPKRLVARTPIDRTLLAQSSQDVESIVRNDIITVLGLEQDRATLFGKGGAEPLGLANTDGRNGVTYSGAATWAKVVESETAVASSNGDLGSMGFILSAAARGRWKSIAKAANYPVFLADNNQANGYPIFATNQIPSTASPIANQSFFGVWSEIIMGTWGGLDVIVNPYSSDAEGQVIITITMLADIGIRHPASFCVSTDTSAA